VKIEIPGPNADGTCDPQCPFFVDDPADCSANVEAVAEDTRPGIECPGPGVYHLTKINAGSLSQDDEGDNDYTLKEDQTSCWITVDNLSVYVHRTDEGVIADILPRKGEDGDPIASCYAFFNEGSIFCRVCEKEFVEAGSRDGFDGMCPDCADKAEAENEIPDIEGGDRGTK